LSPPTKHPLRIEKRYVTYGSIQFVRIACIKDAIRCIARIQKCRAQVPGSSILAVARRTQNSGYQMHLFFPWITNSYSYLGGLLTTCYIAIDVESPPQKIGKIEYLQFLFQEMLEVIVPCQICS